MQSFPPAPERRRNWLVWIVAGLAAIVLCQLIAAAALIATVPGVRDRALALIARPSGPPPPDAPARDQRATSGDAPLLIADTFDAPTNLWDQSQTRIVDEALELRIDIPNYDSYGLYLGPSPPEDPEADAPILDASVIDDFDLAVDVRQTAGDPLSEYGIRFRQSGPGDYLLFSISGNGYYRLLRVRNEQYEPIVPWTFDGRIRTGAGATNRLRVVAQGAAVEAYINDVRVVQIEDEIDVGGQLTFGVQTYDAGGLAVQFDNISGSVGGVDLAEDFSDPATVRWSSGGSQIIDGQYEIIAGGGIQTWQQPLPTGSSRVSNFALEVDATLVATDGVGAAYGVMFGDGGSFDFYSVFLFPEGGLAIYRSRAGGGPEAIVPPVAAPQVNAGLNATNRIRVEVEDGVLTLELNGELIGQLDLQEDVRGMVGLIVSAGDSSETRVRFDNFRLEELR
jgi:hypothetical protein